MGPPASGAMGSWAVRERVSAQALGQGRAENGIAAIANCDGFGAEEARQIPQGDRQIVEELVSDGGVRLQVEGLDDEPLAGTVHLGVEATDQPAAMQDGKAVVAVA